METTIDIDVLLCVVFIIILWVLFFFMIGMIPFFFGTKHSQAYSNKALTHTLDLETIPITAFIWTFGFKIGESVFRLKYGKARSAIGTIKSSMYGIPELS